MRFPRARRRRSVVRRGRVGLVVVATLAATMMLGLSAANTVPGSKATNKLSAVTAQLLKPASCNALTLTAVVTGSGTFAGTGAAELILGSAGVDTISGGAGDDCILGGGGNDAIRGQGGTDVCIGGPGTNMFATCETTL